MVSLIYCIDLNVERQNFCCLFCIRYCIVIDNDHIDTAQRLNWRNLHLNVLDVHITKASSVPINWLYIFLNSNILKREIQEICFMDSHWLVISIDEGVQMLLLFKLIFSCYGLVWWLWTKYLHLGNEVPPESYSSYLLHSLIRIM